MKKYTWFSEEEFEKIKNLNNLGYNDVNIAEIIGRSRMGVRRHRVRMGLPVRNIHTQMSINKGNKKRNKTMIFNTGDSNNYLAKANQIRSLKLGWPEYQLSEALILYVLRDGPLETPKILEKIEEKKTYENWKPFSMSLSRFATCASNLKKDRMIETIYNPRIVPDRRKLPRLFSLIEKSADRSALEYSLE